MEESGKVPRPTVIDLDYLGDISYLYTDKGISLDDLNFDPWPLVDCDIPVNSYWCFSCGSQSVLKRWDGTFFWSVSIPSLKKFACKNLEQKYLIDALYNQAIPLVTVFGGAGSGKTFVTMVAAINMLDEKKYDKIILTKSRAQATTSSGGRIGDVPGTLIEKMRPVLSSYERALAKIWGKSYQQIFEQKISDGKIECIPLEYMRGEDFTNALVICDEAQNVEIHQFKTLITRLGEKSKLILMADTDQIDEKENRKGKACPVLQMINMSIYDESYLTAFVRLIEIERSELAALGIEICKKLEQ